MARPVRYYMLMSSLPVLPPLFHAKQLPISRLRLEQRLRLLEGADAAELDRTEKLLSWERLSLDVPDATLVEQAAVVLPRLQNPAVRAIVQERLELRTAVAALRRRQRGGPEPRQGEPWGHGRWVDHIRRHWRERTFQLEPIFPWLGEAERLMRAGGAAELERLLMDIVWTRLTRAVAGHYFDFLAVTVYVLKWDLLERRLAYDGGAALERFDSLTREGLGEFDRLFEPSG